MKIIIRNLDSFKKERAAQYIKDYFYDWAVNENWKPGKHDMKLYFATYPHAFYVLEVVQDEDKDNVEHFEFTEETPDAPCEPAAIIFAPQDPKTFQASIGAYISEEKKYRGKGLAFLLWQYVFKKLDKEAAANMGYDKCPISLYGVPEQVPTYQKSGFETTGDIWHYLMRPSQTYGPLWHKIETYLSKKEKQKLQEELKLKEELKSQEELKLKVKSFLDQYSTSFSTFVAQARKYSDIKTKVAIDPATQEIIGIGMIRPLKNKKPTTPDSQKGMKIDTSELPLDMESYYRYTIIVKPTSVRAADDLLRALNRDLQEEEIAVLDVEEDAPMRRAYDHYLDSESDSPPIESNGKTVGGISWTKAMLRGKIPEASTKDWAANALPSLETDFLPTQRL